MESREALNYPHVSIDYGNISLHLFLFGSSRVLFRNRIPQSLTNLAYGPQCIKTRAEYTISRTTGTKYVSEYARWHEYNTLIGSSKPRQRRASKKKQAPLPLTLSPIASHCFHSASNSLNKKHSTMSHRNRTANCSNH